MGLIPAIISSNALIRRSLEAINFFWSVEYTFPNNKFTDTYITANTRDTTALSPNRIKASNIAITISMGNIIKRKAL